MSGGYFSCGEFRGQDKSGSPFEAVVLALADRLTGPARADFEAQVLKPVETALAGPEDYMLLERPLIEALVGPLRKYHEHLGATLGYPEPSQAPALDDHAGVDPIEAKWGAGNGWRYYCTNELIKACEVSLNTGEPVVFTFD